MKIGIIGAGPLGLSLAHFLSKTHQVTVLEKDNQVGGLGRGFKFKDKRIDRYYHFIFLNDHHTIKLAEELGISKKIIWNNPKMGVFIDGKVYPFSTPVDLIRFPHFSFVDKLRFVTGTIRIGLINNWKPLETQNGLKWLRKVYGRRVTDVLWEPLMKKKFRHHYKEINAAWCWNEIYRRKKSRKLLEKEKLGCFKEGTFTILNKLQESVEKRGKILFETDIKRIYRKDKLRIKTQNKELEFDKVFSTIPRVSLEKYLNKKTKLKKIDYLSIRCAVFVLKKSLTGYFWINVNNAKDPQVVVVELTNLRKEKPHIVYVPYYTEFQGKIYNMPDAKFRKMNIDFLKKISPNFEEDSILDYHSFKDPFAQAVFDGSYSDKIPAYETALKGLHDTNQAHIYPERSGVNECVRFAAHLAKHVDKDRIPRMFFTSE